MPFRPVKCYAVSRQRPDQQGDTMEDRNIGSAEARDATYSTAARRFHWWTVLLMAAQVPIGLFMVRYGAATNFAEPTGKLYDTHKLIGLTILYLHNNLGGIGSANLAAPQATLMATIIKGLLNQNLPWGLVLIGIFLSLALELCGVRSLSFAVGSYLPIATTAPIFAGGLVRAWVESKTGKAQESELSAGTLFSSGLIAGGSIAGILFAVLVGTGAIGPFQSIGNALPFLHSDGISGEIATALLFLALAVVVARTAIRKVE